MTHEGALECLPGLWPTVVWRLVTWDCGCRCDYDCGFMSNYMFAYFLADGGELEKLRK